MPASEPTFGLWCDFRNPVRDRPFSTVRSFDALLTARLAFQILELAG